MSVILVFLLVVMAAIFWWLARQGLFSKPWLEVGVIGGMAAPDPTPSLVARIGLAVFLVVVGSLFALTVSAYLMRAGQGDWRSVRLPGILYANTFALLVSSLALETARTGARRGDLESVRTGVLAGGFTALVFLAGQLVAWRQLNAEGYYLASNPANAFFYLVTALHGVHVAGGLVALGRVTRKMLRGAGVAELRLGVDLCATYWHVLLLIWLVLLGLLTGRIGDFVAICRRLLT
ncbi:cytochrome-c oxidase [Kaistia sp. 32K]|uniref:cytochrome c oxidase subunit 3 n=1 Tax=Kaistia sp. 32K TaxID=2795690 RepID=UPI0019167CFC|nr:cytochrome c oxidase subunit 3 [Kaistia sp. 32K]BCP55154.1 cytochrome-c oxidase [Kaistia sp. 32K]